MVKVIETQDLKVGVSFSVIYPVYQVMQQVNDDKTNSIDLQVSLLTLS